MPEQQQQHGSAGWRSSPRQRSPQQEESNILPYAGRSSNREQVGGQDSGGGGGDRCGGRASRPSANATAHSLAMEAQKNGGSFFDTDEMDTRPILLASWDEPNLFCLPSQHLLAFSQPGLFSQTSLRTAL